MAKVKMTIAEALKNHAVIKFLEVGEIYAEEPDIAFLPLWLEQDKRYFYHHIMKATPETICEVELIDAESIEIKIAALQKRLEHLNAVMAAHGVTE